MDGCAVPRRRSGKRGSHLGRRICRQFVNGSCRFGPHCSYLHEYPAVPLVQVCRYFQKGGCWFGENCRYLHIAGPDSGASGARRGSAPVVNASLPGHVSADRWGSEPSLNAPGAYNWRRASEPLVTSLSYQQTSQRPTTGIAEEEEHAVLEAGSILPQQEEGLQPQESDGLGPRLPCNSADEATVNAASDEATVNAASDVQEKTDSKTDQQGVPLLESGATASVAQGQSEAYNQSKDVFCGICMDKVYEKGTVRERRFGILPNCSHAFCLSCIMTWRKTKDFQEEVIKACPQCRVKSPFYIPSKYWVCEGEPKEALIASFKEKSSKIKCNFFMRHGCCPFASECIFSHELPPGHRLHRRCFRPKNALELLEDMDDENQRLLSYLIALTLLDDEDFDFIQFELV
ncbi:makorin, ring finger protein, 4 isoform X2 [Neoarius graeffei]|uniref:makorin, ring finger protein, 4 isoform X2 n=1 Tax=Neoarius graeffei TaxID=443677 RepID=UPI00298CC352|nr:makorin, ring finger protein, 4 isoform X2 [Neoarius graeffei]